MSDWKGRHAPSLADIEELADQARTSLPEPFASAAAGVALQVVDFAPDDILAELGVEDPFELTGLYQGVPLTAKSLFDSPGQPDIIWLFRAAILEEWLARGDVTLDHLQNDGMSATVTGVGPVALGQHKLHLRSTLALANAYYDFGLGNLGLSAAGGAFAYVGAGAGIAFNHMGNVEPGATDATNWGGNTSFAAAGMVGVGYDFGNLVADLGYRGIYINKLENSAAPNTYSIDHALIHEIRGTLRYRFN